MYTWTIPLVDTSKQDRQLPIETLIANSSEYMGQFWELYRQATSLDDGVYEIGDDIVFVYHRMLMYTGESGQTWVRDMFFALQDCGRDQFIRCMIEDWHKEDYQKGAIQITITAQDIREVLCSVMEDYHDQHEDNCFGVSEEVTDEVLEAAIILIQRELNLAARKNKLLDDIDRILGENITEL